MFIVWGQRYFGQDEGFQRYARCEHCQTKQWLRSYTSSKYFTIYWIIPLIPLGKKRISDSCKACDMMREMPESNRQSMLAKAESDLRSEKYHRLADSDEALRDEARAQMTALAFFDPLGKFEQLAPGLEKGNADNPFFLDALSGAYLYLDRLDDAERVLYKAIQSSDHKDIKTSLAVVKARKLKLDEARELTQFVLDEKDTENAKYLFLLLEAYLHTDQYSVGKELLAEIAEFGVDMTCTPDYEYYEEAFKTPDIRRGDSADSIFAESKPIKPLSRGLPTWLPGAFLSLVLLGILWSVFGAPLLEGWRRTVHLVNGTNAKYSVIVNGVEHQLLPHQRLPITVSEGDIKYQVKAPLYTSKEKTVKFSTKYWSRFAKTPIVVLNPDATALLVKAQTYYYSSDVPKSQIPGGKSTVFTGEEFVHFDDIDYPFRSFPTTLSMSKHDRHIAKTRLYVFHKNSSDDLTAFLNNLSNKEKMPDIMKRLALLDPKHPIALAIVHSLAYSGQDKEFIEFMKPGLESKDINIEFHRAFQNAKERIDPTFDLVSHYKKLLEEDPKDPKRHYLYGRVLNAVKLAEKHFMLAETTGVRPIGYGYYALAYRKISDGDFAEALDLALKALRAANKNQAFEDQVNNCRLALRSYQPLIDYINVKMRAKNAGLYLQRMRILYYALAEQESKAVSAKNQLLKHFMPIRTRRYQEAKHSLNALIAYGKEDWTTFCNEQSKLKEQSDDMKFQVAALSSNFEAMISFLNRPDSTSMEQHLAAYCKFKKLGQSEDVCEEQLIMGADMVLFLGSAESREAARMLRGPVNEVSVEDFQQLTLSSDYKRIIATALGYKCPELREKFFAIARQHNYNPMFPWGVIHQLVDGGPENYGPAPK